MNRSPKILSMGNMLVEIMRPALDQALDAPGTFAGPYPSGDTVIYIGTVARLGGDAGFIGCVGADDFGVCLLTRLRSDGLDCSQIQVLREYATGVAFVAYFSDGSRKFLFHWRHAAAGQLAPGHVKADYFSRCEWLHITGCNLAVCESSRLACLEGMRVLPAGARLSFDPNIRPGLLGVEEIRALCRPFLDRADVVFPSATEAAMLTGAKDDDEGCRQLAARGKTVLLKRGSAGCRVFTPGGTGRDVPSFEVAEVDPTGAGDSFCAGFTAALLEGMDVFEAARFANAVGALSVRKRGPMEGAPFRAQVTRFLETGELPD
jgi:sugar/nucleoside kinase (ribokinase family)